MLDYDTYVAQLGNLMAVANSTDAYYQIFLPGCIDYAEQRLYRELDPLEVQITDTTTLSSGNRNVSPPTSLGTYITVDQINVITPSTATSSNGTRNPLVSVSPEVMDSLYPSGQTITGVPAFFAMRSPTTVLLGPSPDAAYQAEFIGIQRPTALSSSNTTTFLTTYCPDLFIAASMVFAMGYQRDFGAQSDDPKASQSWEAQYQALLRSAGMEQARAKWQSDGWTAQAPAPAGPRQ